MRWDCPLVWTQHGIFLYDGVARNFLWVIALKEIMVSGLTHACVFAMTPESMWAFAISSPTYLLLPLFYSCLQKSTWLAFSPASPR